MGTPFYFEGQVTTKWESTPSSPVFFYLFKAKLDNKHTVHIRQKSIAKWFVKHQPNFYIIEREKLPYSCPQMSAANRKFGLLFDSITYFCFYQILRLLRIITRQGSLLFPSVLEEADRG